jgi:hypothetical protein
LRQREGSRRQESAKPLQWSQQSLLMRVAF